MRRVVTAAELNGYEIEADTGEPLLALAAEELRAHLRRLPGGARNGVLSCIADRGASDGFTVTVRDGAVTVAGDSPKGALNGAYWLLEQLGFAWVQPGEDGLRFASGRSLAAGEYRQEPAFGRRTLILGNDALHDDWRDWHEWAARNRLNSVFFHDTPPSVLDRGGARRPASTEAIATDGRGWMFERWDSDGAAIRSDAARRGLDLQFGGHHLPALLRRELFARHPDWFPQRQGRRDARYNLCTSSEGAVAEVRARARDFFARFAGAAVYHLWADDILGGGWCACERCAALAPSDQALRATNIVADVLAAAAPGASIAHLAYHDTIAPPAVERPAANVTALYAPRNRNYAFAIDDPACPRNAEDHLPELRGLAGTFAGRPGALAVFEYYSDAILYKWLAPPNLRVLPADARAYRAAGVFDFGDLAVTPRPWAGPVWHAWWFARCAWDPAADAEAALSLFCEAAFESDGAAAAGVLRAFDAGYRLLLDLGGLQRIPRHDVLDFSDTPREALASKARQVEEATTVLNAAVASLPVRPAGLGVEFRDELAVQLAAANHLASRVLAWDAALDGRRAEAESHLWLARFHLRALEDWLRTHDSPAFANLSERMLQAARFHTDGIASLAGA